MRQKAAGNRPVMRRTVTEVIFQDHRYVMPDGPGGGPIARKEAYEHGLPSDCHLFRDGKIRCFGQVVGCKADIQPLGKIEVEIDEADACRMIGDWIGHDCSLD